MKQITIYSSLICPFCIAAKKIFIDKGLNYIEIVIDGNDELKKKMISLTNGKKTVPQIFFDDILVGGYSDLSKLVVNGKLHEKLED